jgi:hypothetical protein
MPSIGTRISGAMAGLRRRPVHTLACLLPAAYALVLGLHELSRVRGERLCPDATGFLVLARQMDLKASTAHPWFPGITTVFNGWREPLWPAAIAVPVRVFGAGPTLVRLLGVAGFVLLVVAFQRLVTRLYSRAWGIGAALLLAASPWLVFQSARGLREEASTGLVLLFAAAVIKGIGGRRLVLLAAAAAALALLRWDTVLLTVPTLVIAGVANRTRPRRALLATSVFVLLVAPMLLGAKLNYGDPFYFSNTRGAVFFRNVEFAGKPGFPTKAEVRHNGWAGSQITWSEYFFHLHTPWETARRTLSGLTTIPLTIVDCGLKYPDCRDFEAHWPTLALVSNLAALLPWLIGAAGIAGAAMLLRRRGTWPVPLMLLMSMITFAPIARMIDWRLALTSLPLLAVGLVQTLHTTVRRFTAGRPVPPLVSDAAVPTQPSRDPAPTAVS